MLWQSIFEVFEFLFLGFQLWLLFLSIKLVRGDPWDLIVMASVGRQKIHSEFKSHSIRWGEVCLLSLAA